jgi:uncharacterized membrane protein YgaE (UPF0421/DUF939 family)
VKENEMEPKKLRLPGMRTIKTALCVLVCLLVSRLISGQLSLYSALAAIVCMQSTIENSLKTGGNRLLGTAIGGGFGMLLVSLVSAIGVGPIFFALVPLGCILVTHTCNIMKLPGSVVISAIVFISVAASPLSPAGTGDPYVMALFRIADTAIGIVVAMLVNRYIAPPKLYEDRHVHLICDSFHEVYHHVKPMLSGEEQLILYNGSLTTHGVNRHNQGTHIRDDIDLYVRMPVPTEYVGAEDINAVYITSQYGVIVMKLPQRDGFVEIPGSTLPCTVAWQAAEEKTKLLSPFK